MEMVKQITDGMDDTEYQVMKKRTHETLSLLGGFEMRTYAKNQSGSHYLPKERL